MSASLDKSKLDFCSQSGPVLFLLFKYFSRTLMGKKTELMYIFMYVCNLDGFAWEFALTLLLPSPKQNTRNWRRAGFLEDCLM